MQTEEYSYSGEGTFPKGIAIWSKRNPFGSTIKRAYSILKFIEVIDYRKSINHQIINVYQNQHPGAIEYLEVLGTELRDRVLKLLSYVKRRIVSHLEFTSGFRRPERILWLSSEHCKDFKRDPPFMKLLIPL